MIGRCRAGTRRAPDWSHTVWEDIKLIGSIAGLATAAFTIWDRLLRWRPLAFISVSGTAHNFLTHLNIKNVSPINILVKDIRCYPNYFRVATGTSVKQIARAISRVPVLTVLPPNEQTELQLFQSPNRGADAKPARVFIFVYWRKTSYTWLPQIPVLVLTSTSDLEKMGQGLN